MTRPLSVMRDQVAVIFDRRAELFYRFGQLLKLRASLFKVIDRRLEVIDLAERFVPITVVFQKWRSTASDVTLGLMLIASQSRKWPVPCIAVRCPHCHSEQIVKRGKTRIGTQRYLCQNTACTRGGFLLDDRNRGCLPEVKHLIIDMSLNASGVRNPARVLRISPGTVLHELKNKETALESVNNTRLRTLTRSPWISSVLAKLRWMRCGALSARKPTRAGCGMP
jgi:transposase-like protein